MPGRAVCENPIGIEAEALDGGSQELVHIDLEMGFYCVNDEQGFGTICADFKGRDKFLLDSFNSLTHMLKCNCLIPSVSTYSYHCSH